MFDRARFPLSADGLRFAQLDCQFERSLGALARSYLIRGTMPRSIREAPPSTIDRDGLGIVGDRAYQTVGDWYDWAREDIHGLQSRRPLRDSKG